MESTCRACPKLSVILASRKRAATTSCGGPAKPLPSSSTCRRTGCRGSSSMHCVRPGPSRSRAVPHWSRPANHDLIERKRQARLKPSYQWGRSSEDGMEMHGQSVIVTGGASGIGKATAVLLAREGARVFVGDIDETGGGATPSEAAAEGLAVEYLPLDLTDPSSIAGFAAAVHQRTDRIDGLVNGAGWDQIQPFLENPP